MGHKLLFFECFSSTYKLENILSSYRQVSDVIKVTAETLAAVALCWGNKRGESL